MQDGHGGLRAHSAQRKQHVQRGDEAGRIGEATT